MILASFGNLGTGFLIASYFIQNFYVMLSLMPFVLSCVTRLGNLLDFGQLFKAFCNNYFAQMSHILGQFL